ncbi:peptidase U32 [Bifidobacterium adolescentis]|nr:peptidase U32 [Bifidobacterium adolescentis]
MEHIVQFAIDIDDETIQNRIEEHAYSDVLNKLTKNAVDSVFSHSSAYTRDIMWEGLMGEALQSFLEERKDEIIDKAANMLADRFQRTKKYREAMGAVIAKDGE